MNFLALRMRGELWAAYPQGMRFPPLFRRYYPLRGAGLVARLLYILNRSGLDKFLLPKLNETERSMIPDLDGVAFFWPSATRSRVRFYGYKVVDGRVVSYLKFANTRQEAERLRAEAANVERVRVAVPNRCFEMPSCRMFSDLPQGIAMAEYDCLPDEAMGLPLSGPWLQKVERARRQIVSAGLSHGDFMWHNMKAVGERLYIIDWEELAEIGENRPALTDEISFFAALEHYNRRRPLGAVYVLFKKRYFDDQNRKHEAIASVRSMRRRGIAMGELLLGMIEKDSAL